MIAESGFANSPPRDPVIVIAHRGASGYLPEHTLAAYAMAILQGADYIEPDLVMTCDGHLIARHDNVLDRTTDVAQRPAFATRRTTRQIDGTVITGWFSEDFTLAEIQTLRAVERLPEVRPANCRFDGQFTIPTLADVLKLVRAMERATDRKIGIYPETKHPTHFQQLGLPLEEPLLEALHRHVSGSDQPVFIQSFEVANLLKMRSMTNIPLIQLLAPQGQPYDVMAAGGSLNYDQMATPEGLADIAIYADGVAPEKNHFLLPLDRMGRLDPGKATDFVQHAHQAGLKVHPYTFRAENDFLPINHRLGTDPTLQGDMASELALFLALGIDGFFTDHPDLGARARNVLARQALD
jgi:glycerophosphoryl diester phosphodiesterase